MKILFVAPADNAHTQRWARAFIDRGYEIAIFSPMSAEISGAKIYIANKKKYFQSIPIDFDIFQLFIKFRKILKKYKPDIVHIHYIPSHWSNLFFFTRIKNLVVSVWGSDIIYDKGKENMRSHYYKYFLLRKAKVVCATTKFLAKQTKKYLPQKKPINIIPFGVDTNRFRKSSKKNKHSDQATIRIGFVKHLLPKYGPEVLLNAFKKISHKDNNVELLIVGKGYLDIKLKEMTRSFKLEEKVHFLGPVPHKEVPSMLSNIDIFAMPSVCESESFGVAAIEAEAMEIPVVASYVGGIPEAVVNGKTGILVRPNDPDNLAEALSLLIHNKKLRHEMGKTGRKFVQDNYEWQENVNQMEKIYLELLSKK